MVTPTAELLALSPCPGCNADDCRVIGGPGTAGGPQYWAGCMRCRWRTWGDTEADAIKAWNTRARPSLSAQAVEQQAILPRPTYGYPRTERELKEALASLEREYRERSKPYIDQLIFIENLKPPKPIFLTPTPPQPADGGDRELREIADEMRNRKVNHGKAHSPTLITWADRIDAALAKFQPAGGES